MMVIDHACVTFACACRFKIFRDLEPSLLLQERIGQVEGTESRLELPSCDLYEGAMPASTIAAILLRLFALNYMLSGVLEAIKAFYLTGGSLTGVVQIASISAVQIILGVVCWWVAPRFSRVLAGQSNEQAKLAGVTEEQLYATTFLGLGLWFALSSFAAVFNWIHYFAVDRSKVQGSSTGEETTLYGFMESLLTLSAGLVLIFTCKTWAAKVARRRSGRSGMPAPDIN